MSVELLWHKSLRKHLIRTMFASRLPSVSEGIVFHPITGSVKWQITRSNNIKSVMSNFFESGGSPVEGNSCSHWSSKIFPFLLKSSSKAKLLFNAVSKVEYGIKEWKTSLRVCVPPSISNRANLAKFVFSCDESKMEDISAVKYTFLLRYKRRILGKWSDTSFEESAGISFSWWSGMHGHIWITVIVSCCGSKNSSKSLFSSSRFAGFLTLSMVKQIL